VTVIESATGVQTVFQTVTVVSAASVFQTIFSTSTAAACPLQTPTPSNDTGYLAVIIILLILLGFALFRRRRQTAPEIKVQ